MKNLKTMKKLLAVLLSVVMFIGNGSVLVLAEEIEGTDPALEESTETDVSQEIVPEAEALPTLLEAERILAEEVGAGNSTLTFEETECTFDILEGWGTLYLSEGTAEKFSSSNEAVATIDWEGDESVDLLFHAEGTTEITATAVDGTEASCTVKVVKYPFSFEKDVIEIALSQWNEEYIYLKGGTAVRVSNSNPKVAQVETYDDDEIYMLEVTPLTIGETIITAVNEAGEETQLTVRVVYPPLILSETSISLYVEQYAYLDAYNDGASYDDEITYTFKSSNAAVVKAYADKGNDYCELEAIKPGKATITVTDSYGQTATCKVTVTAPPFTSNIEEIILKSYDDPFSVQYIDELAYAEIVSNYIESAEIEDESTLAIGDDGVLIPKKEGTTAITLVDEWGQSLTLPITVEAHYLDDYNYYYDLWPWIEDVFHGDTLITGYSGWELDGYHVSISVGGKTYAKDMTDPEFIFKGIPAMQKGAVIAVTCSKGLSSVTETFTVKAKPITKLKVSGIGNKTYTGKAIKPAVTVKDGTKTLKAGTDYTVNYSSNKNVGTAKAVVTMKGNYSGKKTLTFNIIPKGASLKSLTKASKAITVKWNKQSSKMSSSRITGYQIQVATNSAFTKNKKTITVKGYNNASKKITKLLGNKKYYVRIRTYKQVGKTNYYSSWSKVKTIKTKK